MIDGNGCSDVEISCVLVSSPSPVEGDTSFRSLQLGLPRVIPLELEKNILEEKPQTLKGTIDRCAYETNNNQTFEGWAVLQSTPFFASPGFFQSTNPISI
jgi:hypothetical protein